MVVKDHLHSSSDVQEVVSSTVSFLNFDLKIMTCVLLATNP
jgi:hypothetical protein